MSLAQCAHRMLCGLPRLQAIPGCDAGASGASVQLSTCSGASVRLPDRDPGFRRSGSCGECHRRAGRWLVVRSSPAWKTALQEIEIPPHAAFPPQATPPQKVSQRTTVASPPGRGIPKETSPARSSPLEAAQPAPGPHRGPSYAIHAALVHSCRVTGSSTEEAELLSQAIALLGDAEADQQVRALQRGLGSSRLFATRSLWHFRTGWNCLQAAERHLLLALATKVDDDLIQQ